MNTGAANSKHISKASNTREKLLLTAMHLYARDGLGGVSLRSISAAAGSKNSAAMHYHFHNRPGVIQALVNLIASELRIIAEAIAQDAPARPSVREAFRNTLLPLTELPRRQPWGEDAVRFMSRAISENDPEIAAIINPVYQAYWQKIDKDLATLAPELPAKVRQLRIVFMSVNLFHGVAEVGSLAHTPFGDLRQFTPDELIDQLVDYLMGGFQAPSYHKYVAFYR